MVKRVLITGGAGFIGSHLCSRLMQQGCDVICLDNFITSSKKNVEQFIGNPYFELVRHDILHPFYAETDEIYNLACPASPVHYQKNPIKTIKTSVIGSINLLGLAKRTHAKILQASTSEIYGDPLEHPQSETYWGNVNPIGVRSCYDEGKRCAESLFMNYYLQNKVRIKIARIFNTFGPNMDLNDGRVVSNFIVQALKNEPITVYGEGLQVRSFQYVDDLIEGLLRFMQTDDDVTGPINLGNPVEMTVLALAHKIIDLTGSASKIVFEKLPADDPIKRKPDISKAMELLNGWMPTIDINQGLLKTIDYFEDQLKLK